MEQRAKLDEKEPGVVVVEETDLSEDFKGAFGVEAEQIDIKMKQSSHHGSRWKNWTIWIL